MAKRPITIARGDGIGPDIMDATLRILEAAGAQLELNEIEIGEKLYEKGNSAGIEDSSWATLRRTGIFLKSPITTPQGGGVKSLNVTTRKAFGLFANIRPCVAYHPFVKTKYPGMDMIVVRENEEGTYAGIEYRPTHDVREGLKLISRPGCEKIIRYAFEYARAYGRKRVTCMSKDNIMKITDGLFHKIFDEIATEYPDINTGLKPKDQHMIIDIGSARIADKPTDFDVVVTLNLYGDIISDIAAEVAGSVGLGGSVNIGPTFAMFEAVHGSWPDGAGKDIANPSGLLKAAVMMLIHIGQPDVATKVENALLRTLEEGAHTGDIYVEGQSKKKVGTREFTDTIIKNIGKTPEILPAVNYGKVPVIAMPKVSAQLPEKKQLVGIDMFIGLPGNTNIKDLAEQLQNLSGNKLELMTLSNRGVTVWPEGQPETFCVDQWCARFMANDNALESGEIAGLFARLLDNNLDVVQTQNLYEYDGKAGFSLGQGQKTKK